MLDKAELRELGYRYARAIDRRDCALLLSCYAEGAVDRHGAMFEGDAVAFADWQPEVMAPFALTAHYIANADYRVQGDRAEGELYFIAFHRTIEPQPRHLRVGGRYLDRYTRVDGAWRIAERSLVWDWHEDRAVSDAELAFLHSLGPMGGDADDPARTICPRLFEAPRRAGAPATEAGPQPDLASGASLGVDFPATIEGLREAGAEFLTEAFRASGALSADNAVTAITRFEPFEAGGMGPKLLLDVAYRRDVPELHRELFAKLPRPPGDPLRPLFAPVFEPEVCLYLLARDPAFPIDVPKVYFADFDPATLGSLIVTERIAYGREGIEPCQEKAMDDRLVDPLPYYRAVTAAAARLAGTDRAGGLGPAADVAFPFDPDAVDVGARIPYSAAQLADKAAVLRRFAAEAPQLFVDGLGDAAWLERLSGELPLALAHEQRLRAELNGAADFIALCH